VSSLSLYGHGHNTSWQLSGYGLSIGVTATAAVGTSLLHIFSPGAHNFIIFFAAIAFVAWYAGPGPGWLSVGLSTFVANYVLPDPEHIISLHPQCVPWLIAFVACGAATNAVATRRRHMENALQRAQEDLEERIRERTLELRNVNDKLIREINEHHRAEIALRQSQAELGRAARIMNLAELTASIAHEINQPLAAVVSNGEAARNWLRRSPAAARECGESIDAAVTAALRAAEIITRIRRLFSKAVPQRRTVHINKLVDDAIKLARVDLNKRNIVINCRLDPMLPQMIGDPIQLQQALLNMINNASDSMAAVSDRTRALVIETHARGNDGISITVADTGQGFCGHDVNMIFEPFCSTKQNGMGIGLSVCRTVIRSHGGSIRAMEGRPYGAVFQIDLPAGQCND
jgi:C4-dicarboxylate-specific signal transduction histidine kinase